MPVDGVNKITTDGRVRLTPELTEKYGGEYVSLQDRGGQIVLTVVEDDGSDA